MTNLIDQIKDHALAHYNRGGWDFLVETMTDEDIAEKIGGTKTLRGAIAKLAPDLRLWDELRRDQMGSRW